jgi:hypothetical protein
MNEKQSPTPEPKQPEKTPLPPPKPPETSLVKGSGGGPKEGKTHSGTKIVEREE